VLEELNEAFLQLSVVLQQEITISQAYRQQLQDLSTQKLGVLWQKAKMPDNPAACDEGAEEMRYNAT
jgi:aspartyl/asparaginyl beta-hydroxylase (cupin superfamily)